MDDLEMTQMEYEFITGTWQGPKGAAYNACYEFCREFGWCSADGTPTPRGYAQIQAYEMKRGNI